MKKILIVLLLSVPVICGKAQTGSRIFTEGTAQIVYTYEPGQFPYVNSVYQELQDKAGNLWFCTTQGIYRYDGASFSKVIMSVGMANNYTYSILEDRKGNIWFSNADGAYRWDGKEIQAVFMPNAENGDFAGLGKYFTPVNTMNNVSGTLRLFEDRSGNMWLYTASDIFRYDERSHSVKTTGISDYLKHEIWPATWSHYGGGLNDMYADKKGNIWFTSGGCGGTNETYKLEGSSLTSPCVLNTCKHDLQTSTGIAAHNKEIAAALKVVTTKENNKSIAYTAAYEDEKGNYWFGTYDSGVYHYDGKNLVRFHGKDGLDKSFVSVFYKDRSGNLWMGSNNGAYCYDGKGLSHFTTKDGLCNKGVFADNCVPLIIEDKAGNLVFAGDGGISVYDHGSFTSYNEKDLSANDRVRCMGKDHEGNIWMGTYDLGVLRYDGKTFTNFTRKVAKS